MILIISSKASTNSPTTGLLSTNVLRNPIVLPPSPQPSVHDEEEEHVDYSGGSFDLDVSMDTPLPTLSKFSNSAFEDFDVEFPLEGKSQLHHSSYPSIVVSS